MKPVDDLTPLERAASDLLHVARNFGPTELQFTIKQLEDALDETLLNRKPPQVKSKTVRFEVYVQVHDAKDWGRILTRIRRVLGYFLFRPWATDSGTDLDCPLEPGESVCRYCGHRQWARS